MLNASSSSSGLSLVGFAIGFGLLFLYCIGMVTGDLYVSGGLTLVYFILMTVFSLRKIKTPLIPLLLALTIIGIYFFKVINEPLGEWDARAIWFFHSKMIYFARGLNQTSDWTHPSIYWSHPGYPELVPIWGAVFSNLAGEWKEQAAKISLLAVLAPCLLWMMSFCQKRLSFLILFLMPLVVTSSFLWNGWMDGLLGIYAFCGVLLLARYESSGERIDFYSAIAALGVMGSLKNDGALLFVSIVLSYIFIFRKNIIYKVSRLTLAGVPLLLWGALKSRWSIQSEFDFLTLKTLTRSYARVFDGSPRKIIESILYWEIPIRKIVLFTLVLVIALTLAKRFVANPLFKFSLMTAAVYTIGLFSVYLATPYDLAFHISTSVSRTTIVIELFFLIAIYSLMRGCEERQDITRVS